MANVSVAELGGPAIRRQTLWRYWRGGLQGSEFTWAVAFVVPIREIVQNDPFWLKEDPHRKAYTELTLFGDLMPIYEVYNPAIAEVNAEHLFSVAMFDVMKEGMKPEAAIDKAFKRAEEIFAKYPIVAT